VHSYSRQTNTQCSRLIQQRSFSKRSIEGRDRYLAESISCIGERVTSKTDQINWGFSKCHGVYSNNYKVSSATNLIVLYVTNAVKERFVVPLIEGETNKLLRRSNLFSFFI